MEEGDSMVEQRQSVLQGMLRGCSRLLLLAGAAVFFVGDKFLYEIKHVNFFVSAVVGILGGSLVMLLGAGIAVACKSSEQEQH
jgi:hypothetical protein